MIKIMVLLSALSSASVITSSIHAEPASNRLNIYFLDVGQGDAMILNQPGICTSLIDAGPLLHGHRITTRLQELGITELDHVIITHPHLDHFGGLFDIHSRVAFNQLYDNGRTNQNKEYFSDYEKIRQKQPYETLSGGENIACGDIKLEVLNLADEVQGEQDLNAASLVLMISYHNFKLLQMGDLAGAAEQSFLKNNADLNADVIKIAHHGAADATSDDLLNRVQPKLAIISTTEDNWINAPSREVLNRLKRRHIPYFRTDQHKTIRLDISKSGQFLSSHGSGDDR
jgi:competence protein ComEC